MAAKNSPIGQLLHQAVDMLDRLEQDPAQLAVELEASDFGGSLEVRIGLNYMKGRIEVLTDELGEVHKAYTELLEKYRNEQRLLVVARGRIAELEVEQQIGEEDNGRD